MLRRSPAEIYLKYMLLHPKKFTHEQIHAACVYAQLDSISDAYLTRLRSELHPPDPFYPMEERHRPSSVFLLREGLHSIFFPNEHGKRAFSLLALPRAKEFIEAMTLCGAPHTAIIYRLNKKNIKCTEKDLSSYLSFFWDMAKVDSTEVRILLQMRVNRMENDNDPAVRDQYKAAKSAFWSDPRRIAAEMPESPFSALVAQMRMGLMPSKLDAKEILNIMFNMASVKAVETIATPGLYSAKNFAEYVNSLRIIKELQDSVESPDDRLQKDLRTLTLRTVDAVIPTIHQLSDGNHTLDLLPQKEDYNVPGPTTDTDDSLDDTDSDLPDLER